MDRPYGRAPRGHKLYGEVRGKRGVRESFIAALWNKKIIAPMGFQGTCNAALFNTWLEKILIPELRPGQILILAFQPQTLQNSEEVFISMKGSLFK